MIGALRFLPLQQCARLSMLEQSTTSVDAAARASRSYLGMLRRRWHNLVGPEVIVD